MTEQLKGFVSERDAIMFENLRKARLILAVQGCLTKKESDRVVKRILAMITKANAEFGKGRETPRIDKEQET